ncbi:hypothetical protein OSK74_24040, partial [Escherichia coli]|nr:hypothetical protein [Escherichia coli]
LMMNPVPWLQMTNMISYQGLVRTFLNAHYFKVIRESDQPEPIFYTFSVIDEEIHYTYFDVNTFEATQLSLACSEDAFFQFMFRCDLPLDFDAFTEIMRLISLHGLDVTAFYK